MPSYITGGADVATPTNGKRLNPAELKIDLLCCGVRIDDTCRIEDEGRPISNTRADLATGLELILPGEMRELWVNAPVREKFVTMTPYHLLRARGEYHLCDEKRELTYSVRLAPKPEWYGLRTSRGTLMAQVGMMQGTCLVVDLGEPCRFWNRSHALGCRCGGPKGAESARTEEVALQDVVETAAMAQKKSGITFVLLRGGYQGAGGLSRIFPYLEALKREVGILVGAQFPAESDLGFYDQARSLGIDHFSFCIDLFNKDYFDRFAAGKSETIGQECYLRALGHCARTMGKGRVAGEIIAGVEPVADTLRAVDYLVSLGVLPLVCIFRPMEETEMADFPPPRSEEMMRVFRHVYEACRAHNLPIGLTPNVHLSVLPHPEDTLYLASDSSEGLAYQRWIFTMKEVMRPYFLRRMRKHNGHGA